MRARFRDAQRLARLHPETFTVPTQGQLERLEPGDFVKVSVAFPENAAGMDGERFWVEVTERREAQLVYHVGGGRIWRPWEVTDGDDSLMNRVNPARPTAAGMLRAVPSTTHADMCGTFSAPCSSLGPATGPIAAAIK